MFRGSSQAYNGGTQETVRARRLKELKDRGQAIRFGSCLDARGLYLLTFFDGMNDKE